MSPIETCCAIAPAPDGEPNTFTNVNPLWHPPGARGIYGGVAIAQSLRAAYATVPVDFVVHSMHCHFLLAGNSSTPVLYTVEVVRDGRTFMTRSVRALQDDSCFFSTVVSFQRTAPSPASFVLADAVRPPVGTTPPVGATSASTCSIDTEEPFETVLCEYAPGLSPATRKPCQWIKAHGRIRGDEQNGDGAAVPPLQSQLDKERSRQRAHICALAYMSDSDFINTVSRAHGLWHFSTDEYMEQTRAKFQGNELERIRMEAWLQNRGRDEVINNRAAARYVGVKSPRRVKMLVSLNHSIFFHNHRYIRADEWLLSEMQNPWTGEERGVVTQHIWTRDGVLVATCIQEGVVRVSDDDRGRL
ncbi:hypothetical protein ASPCAL02367 [Aspergillus calidoustus]|uniref:Acyl-CoA thioesterase II n=1 Tax=Aspergillus calidoustus TaxID=454130 RepID=A0A0U5GQ37_ASPCI|nr:hypothetical protein ASPCAL02367 [Aspergillus calidoustus]